MPALRSPYPSALQNDQAYESVDSDAARAVLEAHYGAGTNLYKFWGSPASVLRAILLGWSRSNHPAQLHYAWDLESAPSLDAGIRETTRRAVALLDLDGVARPSLFEPGCGIGGGVTQVAQMLPHAHVTGLSLVHRQLSIGNARVRAAGLSNASLCCGNYLHAPFADSSFEGIFAIETLIHTPAPERAKLFREMFRVLKPGRTFVSFDGFRLRDPVEEVERACIQDVIDGWTIPLPHLPQEFRAHAEAAGFEVLRQEDATQHVYGSARRIASIARAALQPLSAVALVPLLGGLMAPLGFALPRQARRFVAACRSQVKVFERGLAAYYVHVFRRPA